MKKSKLYALVGGSVVLGAVASGTVVLAANPHLLNAGDVSPQPKPTPPATPAPMPQPQQTMESKVPAIPNSLGSSAPEVILQKAKPVATPKLQQTMQPIQAAPQPQMQPNVPAQPPMPQAVVPPPVDHAAPPSPAVVPPPVDYAASPSPAAPANGQAQAIEQVLKALGRIEERMAQMEARNRSLSARIDSLTGEIVNIKHQLETKGGFKSTKKKKPQFRYPGKIHWVLSGDTVNKIAKVYGISSKQLLAWNPQLCGTSTLKVGTILFLAPPDKINPDLARDVTASAKLFCEKRKTQRKVTKQANRLNAWQLVAISDGEAVLRHRKTKRMFIVREGERHDHLGRVIRIDPSQGRIKTSLGFIAS